MRQSTLGAFKWRTIAELPDVQEEIIDSPAGHLNRWKQIKELERFFVVKANGKVEQASRYSLRSIGALITSVIDELYWEVQVTPSEVAFCGRPKGDLGLFSWPAAATTGIKKPDLAAPSLAPHTTDTWTWHNHTKIENLFYVGFEYSSLSSHGPKACSLSRHKTTWIMHLSLRSPVSYIQNTF